MPFSKEDWKGNKEGRPKGSVNIATLERRGLVEFIKEEGKDRFLQELNTLEGEKYCKIYKDVIEIAFPKLARHEVTGKDGKDLIPNPILDAVRKDNSNPKDNQLRQESTDYPGGNVSIEDSVDNLISDSQSAV